MPESTLQQQVYIAEEIFQIKQHKTLTDRRQPVTSALGFEFRMKNKSTQ